VKTHFIHLPEVLARTGLSRATIYQYIKAGRFPAQITLGIRAVGWIESEIDDWIETRIFFSSSSGADDPLLISEWSAFNSFLHCS